jgi:hypothetical protein
LLSRFSLWSSSGGNVPAVSKQQQKFMGAAYARAQSGQPRAGDPKMSIGQLRDFASTPRGSLPSRAPKRSFGGGPVSGGT